jgi:hypothetical protein
MLQNIKCENNCSAPSCLIIDLHSFNFNLNVCLFRNDSPPPAQFLAPKGFLVEPGVQHLAGFHLTIHAVAVHCTVQAI